MSRSSSWTPTAAGSTLCPGLGTAPASRSEPAWSPDGRRIAFTVQHDDPRTRKSFLDLYVMMPTAATNNAFDRRAQRHAPPWSPDGRRLAFQRLHDRHRQIYVMDADGSRQIRLTG